MRSFFVLSLLGLVAANNNTTGDATTTTAAAASNVTTTTAAATTTTAAATTTTAAPGGGDKATKNVTVKAATSPAVEAEFKGWKSNNTCAEILANEDLQSEISKKVVSADTTNFGEAQIAACTGGRRLAAGRNLAGNTLDLTVRIYPKAGIDATTLKAAAKAKISAIKTSISSAFTDTAGFAVDDTGVTEPTDFTAKTITNLKTGTVTLSFFTDSKCTTAGTDAAVPLTVGASTCTEVKGMGTNVFMKAVSYEDVVAGMIQFGKGGALASCTGEEVFGRDQCIQVATGKYMKPTIGAAAASSTSGAVSTGLGAAAALTAAVLMF